MFRAYDEYGAFERDIFNLLVQLSSKEFPVPTVFPNVVFDCPLHFFAIGVSTSPFMYVHIVQGLDKKLGQIQKGTIALPACHFAKAI